MKHLASCSLVASLLLYVGGCGEPSCPAGTINREGHCDAYAPDGSAEAMDGAVEAGADAGAASDGATAMLDAAAPEASSAECRTSVDCPGARPRCSPQGACVACVTNAHCAGSASGPFCMANECVACRTHGDCEDPLAPQCDAAGQCGACASDEACAEHEGAPHCALEGTKRGQCVECVANDDCSDPGAPECKATGRCGRCLSSDACAHRADTPYCHRRVNTPAFGQCVACTSASADVDCGGSSCVLASGTCSTTARRSRVPCQSCQTDSECIDGAACVQHVLGNVDLGYFCFYAAVDGNCGRTATALKPYTLKQYASSIDGNEQDAFCLPVTSCQALDDASNAPSPGAHLCTRDDDCGVPGVADGLCSPSGRCTYACEEPADCASDIASCKFPNASTPKQCSS